MKKFLALVLALVMTMSLVTISAGAEDFTDADKVTYTEAVEVMTAVGVVGGYADGSFNPTAGLTRGAAAKIICNMLLGPTTAEALSANEAPFSDVAVDNVFAGYIAYCVNEGIISGYADGTFKPAAPLTGYAFMKMLLGALGYDAAVEGYVGTNWSIQVAKRALNIGLDDGLVGDFAGAKALTREEACLYALNTLEATMVEYDNASTIKVGDIEITNNSKAEEVKAAGTSPVGYDDTDDVEDATVQFCEKYFKDLSKVAGVEDDFDRPASHKWFNDTDEVVNVMKTVALSTSAKMTDTEVVEALRGYKLGTAKILDEACGMTKAKAAEVAIDGVTYDWDVVSTDNLAEFIAGHTGNGKLIEVYATAKKVITDVVIVNYSTVEAGKVTTNAKTGDVSYVVDGGTYYDYADEDKTDTIVLVEELEKGDIVTIAKVNGKCHVYPTESFQATQSATKTKDGVQTITLDGSAYTVGAAATGSFNNSTTAANYYLDQFGYVVYTDAIASVAQYAHIVDVLVKDTVTIDGTTPTVEVRAVLADGTVGVYTVKLEKTSGNYYIKNIGTQVVDKATSTTAVTNAIKGSSVVDNTFKYTLDGDVITLTALTSLGAVTEYETTGVANIANVDATVNKYNTYGGKTVVTDAKTQYVVFNDDKDTAVVYTGALPKSIDESIDAADKGFAIAKTTTSSATLATASVIFIDQAAGLGADATTNYVYIKALGYTTTGTGDDTVYTYTATDVAGQPMDLTTDDTADVPSDGLYLYTKDNTVGAAFSGSRVKSGSASIVGELVGISGTYYDMNEDTQVVYIDTELTEVDNNTVVLVLDADLEFVEAIFVYAD